MMNWESPKVYAVKHKDNEIRMESRSGGIFTALSDDILKQGGVVYGCVLTEEFEAIHIRAENAEDRNRMRGSKYIQSNIGEIYKEVQADLKEGRQVLFSGTSCQVSGLKSFLGKVYDNLFSVDIVCHGVPSPKVWKDYIIWQEKKNKGRCVQVDFRNKKDHGWLAHVETLKILDKSGRKKEVHSEVFKTLFYGHSILRPSCYQCPYKSVMHPGDITIADYWGIDKAAPGFNDNKGVSLVLINNEKGFNRFEQVSAYLVYKVCKIEDSMQPPLREPFKKPEKRDLFWQDFHTKTFDLLAKRYGDYGLVNKIKKVSRKIKKLARI